MLHLDVVKVVEVALVMIEPTPPTTTVDATIGGGALGEALASHMLWRKSTGTLRKRLRQLLCLSGVAALALMVC
jgi:hypothetical protein